MTDPASSLGSGGVARGGLLRVGLGRHGRWLVYALPLTWLALFFLLPFFFVLKISLAEAIIAQPPYTPLIA